MIDLLMFVSAFLLTEAFSYRYATAVSRLEVLVRFSLVFGVTLLSFLATKSYRTIIRHSGFNDLYTVSAACIMPYAALCVLNFVNNRHPFIESRFLLSYGELSQLFAFLFVMMIVVRLFLQRIYNDYFKRQRPGCNVVIYGAGAAGVIAYNALQQDVNVDYKVVAFVDDDRTKRGKMLDSVPVLSAKEVVSGRFMRHKGVQ